MSSLEYSPLLIDAHRDYLRSLYRPAPAMTATHRSARTALAFALIRLGQWLDDRRPITTPSAVLPESAGRT